MNIKKGNAGIIIALFVFLLIAFVFVGSILYLKSKLEKVTYKPVDVTDLGIETLFRLVQPEKASSPIHITELGMVMFFNPVQLINAA